MNKRELVEMYGCNNEGLVEDCECNPEDCEFCEFCTVVESEGTDGRNNN